MSSIFKKSNALKLIASNRGQQTVEFVLMLAAVATFIAAFTLSFHKELAGAFFSLIGNILT